MANRQTEKQRQIHGTLPLVRMSRKNLFQDPTSILDDIYDVIVINTLFLG